MRIEQHPSQAWMQGKPQQQTASCGDLAALCGAESFEQHHGRVDAILRRPVEPLEGALAGACPERSRRAPRQDRQDWRGQINASNLSLSVRTQPITRIPQSPRDAWTKARRSSGTLIGAVERDAFGRQGIDAPFGVVARDLVEAGIDHCGDARNGQRCFRNIRGHDDLASASG